MVTKKLGPPIQVLVEKCAGCLTCELRCSLRFEKSFLLSGSAIEVRRRGDGAYRIAFTPKCDNCGLCARYCLYRALLQEKKGV